MSSELYQYIMSLPEPTRTQLKHLISQEISSRTPKLVPLECKFSIIKPEIGQAIFKNELPQYLIKQCSNQLLHQIENNLLDFVKIYVNDGPRADDIFNNKVDIGLICYIEKTDKHKNLNLLSDLIRRTT